MRYVVVVMSLFVIGLGVYLFQEFYAGRGDLNNELEELAQLMLDTRKVRKVMDKLSPNFALDDAGWNSFSRNAITAIDSAELSSIKFRNRHEEIEGDTGVLRCRALLASEKKNEKWELDVEVHFAWELADPASKSTDKAWKVTNIYILEPDGAKKPIAGQLARRNATQSGFSEEFLGTHEPTREQRLQRMLENFANLLPQGNINILSRYYPNPVTEMGPYAFDDQGPVFLYNDAQEFVLKNVKNVKVTLLSVDFQDKETVADVVLEYDRVGDPKRGRVKCRVTLGRNPARTDLERRSPTWLFKRIEFPDENGKLVNLTDYLWAEAKRFPNTAQNPDR